MCVREKDRETMTSVEGNGKLDEKWGPYAALQLNG